MVKNKKAFTLVELLAVIVILAVILVIAVPQIMNVITESRKGALASAAKLIASSAETAYISNQTLGIEKTLTCQDVSNYNETEDYTCDLKFEDGKAKVTLTGHNKFNGMYVCDGTKENAEVVSESCTLVSFSIDLNGGSDTVDYQGKYEAGSKVTLVEPTKEGHTFVRWTVSPEDGASINGNELTMGTVPVAITANWTKNTYTITYELDGGTNGTGNPESGEYGAEITLNNPTKTGYTFNEWTAVGGSLNDNKLTIGASNVVLTASWRKLAVGPAVDVIKSLATTGNKEGLITDDFGNIRYAGGSEDVKNYIKFNNEDWRIIGIFKVTTVDEKTGSKKNEVDRIKIVKNDSIGYMSWDSSESSVNYGYGINEWSQADLMEMLHSYYAGILGGCYYCNSYDQKICVNNCSSSIKKIESTYIGMIENVVWNTGAIEYTDSIERREAYTQERGERNGKECTTGNKCTDKVPRTITSIDKVGLIYPSDYGYASTSGTTDIRNSAIGTNNWLNSDYYWTISPRAYSGNACGAWRVYSSSIYSDLTSSANGVRPALYLKSDVSITSGDGSRNLPYQISMN